MEWDVFVPVTFTLTVEGDTLTGSVNGGSTITATDPGSRLDSGGAGFVIEEGTLGSEAITIGASVPEFDPASLPDTVRSFSVDEGSIG